MLSVHSDAQDRRPRGDSKAARLVPSEQQTGYATAESARVLSDRRMFTAGVFDRLVLLKKKKVLPRRGALMMQRLSLCRS